MAGLMAKNLSDTEIAQMFSDYVTRMEEKERHTGAAVKEADAFDTFLESEFPRNVRLQVNLYDRMMNTAIEFEESGFIAGFKTAMALMSGNDDLFPKPIETGVKTAQEQDLATKPNNPTHKPKKTENKAVTEPQSVFTKYIDTTEIAKMFERTNFKTVRSIKEHILPYCTEEQKKNFAFETKREKFKKEQEIIKLSLAGCKLYLEYCERLTYFKNFTEGIELLKKAMEEKWCSGCIA